MIPRHRKSDGFTLIELMIAVAILAIIVAIAIPAYNGYIQRARYSSARANVEPLRIFLENYNLENGGYGAGGANKAALNTNYGWKPEGDDGAFEYKVDVPGPGGAAYRITVTHIASNTGVRCPKDAACTEF